MKKIIFVNNLLENVQNLLQANVLKQKVYLLLYFVYSLNYHRANSVIIC